ncbi:hypothetical protein KJ969_01330 [Patescibacteria group bacterium]|nr:hypothetical protein [Patescibacteria group bacterium]
MSCPRNLSQKINKLFIFGLILVIGLCFLVGLNANALSPDGYPYWIQENVDHWTLKTEFYNSEKVYFGGSELYVLDGGDFSSVGLDLINDRWYHQGNPFGIPGIHTMALNSAGTRMYISGSFTAVKGQARNGIAAVNPETGELLSWYPKYDESPCSSLLISSDDRTIYSFNSSGLCGPFAGVQLHNIRKIDAQTGEITDFNFTLSKGMHFGVGRPLISKDGSRIFFQVYEPYEPNGYKNYIFELNTANGQVYSYDLNFADLNFTSTLVGFSGLYANPDFTKIYVNGGVRTTSGSIVGGIAILNVSTGVISYRSMPETGMGTKVAFTSDGMRIITYTDTDEILAQTGGEYAVIMYDVDFTKYEIIATSRLTSVYHFALAPNDQSIFMSGKFDDESSGERDDRDLVRIMIPQSFSSSAESIPSSNVAIDLDTRSYAISPLDPLSGELAKAPGSSTVYYISNNSEWPIMNEEAFLAWGFRWDDVEERSNLSYLPPVTGFHLGAPYNTPWQIPDGTLAKGSSPAVYVVVDGKLRAIRNASIFNGLGFKWDRIKIFPDSTIARMTRGEDINKPQHPDGVVIKYSNSPEVYYIENGKKRVFMNEGAFKDKGFLWSQIINARNDITYPDGDSIEL